MNAYEYLQALREALAVLPEEEIQSAIHYYENYFLEAGDENAENVIKALGTPEDLARGILLEYTGVARRRPERFEQPDEPLEGITLDKEGTPIGKTTPRKKGINPWVLAALVILAIPIGVPILAALFGVVVAIAAAVFSIGLSLIVIIVTLPFALCIGGGLLFLFSFFAWAQPFSALATLGAGLVCSAIGFLLTLLAIKLLLTIVPPVLRAMVSGLRWSLVKIRDLIRGVLR